MVGFFERAEGKKLRHIFEIALAGDLYPTRVFA